MKETVRFGIFGLRRGIYEFETFKNMPGVEVVAGCDKNPKLCDNFKYLFPKAKAFADFDDFLQHEFDAVYLASPCPDHGPQAVKALEAGKHVLSEVTAFHTVAEGVALVRAVEQSKRKYMLGENFTYFPPVEEMKRMSQAGRLGQFMYGECEYVHDISGVMFYPETGERYWRTWMPALYYCTHALGPILQIAGDRPVSVTGMETGSKMYRGIVPSDMGAALIKLSSGAVVKLLQGFYLRREPGSFWYCVYGTKGCMESDRWNPHWHGHGGPPPFERVYHYEHDNSNTDYAICYVPKRQRFKKESQEAGHCGGDFFVLHDFVEAILNDTKVPIDVYEAADMTLPGMLAYRSALNGGSSMEVPNLRDEAVRKRFENDDWRPVRD